MDSTWSGVWSWLLIGTVPAHHTPFRSTRIFSRTPVSLSRKQCHHFLTFLDRLLVQCRCNGLRVYAVCGCNKVRLPGTGQSAHVIGGSRFTRPASNEKEYSTKTIKVEFKTKVLRSRRELGSRRSTIATLYSGSH